MRRHSTNMRARIVTALVLGLLIVGSAFFLQEERAANQDVVAVPESRTARSYITNSTDWSAELRAATLRAAKDAPELDLDAESATTAGEGTVTDAFARSFFESFVRASAYGTLDAENQDLFLRSSLTQLAQEVDESPFTSRDVRVGARSAAYLRSYGNTLAEITQRHSIGNSENELAILERAMRTDSDEDFATLTNISDAYARVLADTLEVAVPPELIEEHIALLNAYQAVGNDIKGMAEGQTDPVYALVRVQRYESDVAALVDALNRIYTHLYAADIRYAYDEPGALFQVGE